MKRLFSAMTLLLFLVGCGLSSGSSDNIITLRDKISRGAACSFTASVSLDYGDYLYNFVAFCETDATNNMRVTVLEPTPIAGISGEIDGRSGKIVFDEQVLAFELLADEQIVPICVPWLLIKALRGGYINSSGATSAQIDDTFNGCEFRTEVYFNEMGTPSEVEIVWQGKRIASIIIKDFAFL